jgi:transposase
MYRKIYVTASEMLEMRKQGMSNHDIAKSLDISVHTVLRYIGKQGERMENLAAFADPPARKKRKKET